MDLVEPLYCNFLGDTKDEAQKVEVDILNNM